MKYSLLCHKFFRLFRTPGPSLNLNILVRDWAHKMEYDFGHHDKLVPSDFQRNLYHKYFSRQSNNANAMVRASILNDFTNVSIDALPYPGQNLANQVDASPSAGDPVFLQFLKSYIQTHFSPSAVRRNRKRLGGTFATGTDLAELVPRWANYFNSTSLPAPRSIFIASAELQHSSAVNSLATEFNKEVTIFLSSHPDGYEDFESEILQIRSKTLKKYLSLKLLGGSEFKDEYSTTLKTKIDSLLANHRATNNSKLQAAEHRREQERIRLQQIQEQQRIEQEEEKQAQ
jgi:hypothetical protein